MRAGNKQKSSTEEQKGKTATRGLSRPEQYFMSVRLPGPFSKSTPKKVYRQLHKKDEELCFICFQLFILFHYNRHATIEVVQQMLLRKVATALDRAGFSLLIMKINFDF